MRRVRELIREKLGDAFPYYPDLEAFADFRGESPEVTERDYDVCVECRVRRFAGHARHCRFDAPAPAAEAVA